jgi:hypothetical protein
MHNRQANCHTAWCSGCGVAMQEWGGWSWGGGEGGNINFKQWRLHNNVTTWHHVAGGCWLLSLFGGTIGKKILFDENLLQDINLRCCVRNTWIF